MQHLIAAALTALWTTASFYLWSLGQGPVVLLWQSLGIAAFALPAFGWYVMHPPK